MADEVQNQTLSAPLNVSAAAASLPRHGLVSRPYDLSGREFEQLKQFDPVLATMGGAVISFALSNGIPQLARTFLFADSKLPPVPKLDWWVNGIAFVLGIALLISGYFAPRQRRKVMKKINDHFAANPEQVIYKSDFQP